jgi:hypothetical protein
MLKPPLLFATVAAFGLSAQLAQAQTVQPWLSGRGQPAIGLRAGDLELHPGVAGEVGYDSNYFQGAGIDPDWDVVEPLDPSIRVRITPSLLVNTARNSVRTAGAPPPRFDLSAKLIGRLDQLWALDGEFGRSDSSNTSSRTLFGGDLSGTLNILPQRPWGAGISLNVVRDPQPAQDPGFLGQVAARTVVGGAAELRWRPGGGSLDWALGYGIRFTAYDVASVGLDLLEHTVQTRGRWLFLPRTSLLYQAEAKFANYTNPGPDQTNSTPISAMLGLNGLLTSKLGLMLLGGWKSTFFSSPENGAEVAGDYDGPVGRAELTWFISGVGDSGAPVVDTGLSTLRVGYQRDANISGVGDYYQMDRVFADLSYVSASSLTLSLHGGVGWLRHPLHDDQVVIGGDREIHEWRPEVGLFGEYRLTTSVAIFTNNSFSASPKHNYIRLPLSDNGDQFNDDLHFVRFTALIGARWFM